MWVLFTGAAFILRILPLFLLVYYLVPERYRTAVLLLGSYLFYAAGGLRFLPLLMVMSLINAALLRPLSGHRRWALVLTVGLDVFVLILLKLLTLPGFSALMGTFLPSRIPLPMDYVLGFDFTRAMLPALPLGVSFYSFKMISLAVDVYRGTQPRPRMDRALTYYALFPQIVQGPIMRYGQGRFEEKNARCFKAEAFEDGILLFVMGFGMKVLLADRLAILWHDLQKIGFESISTPLAWMGAYAYSLRLYMDFWGYSLMAGGLGRLFGFDFIVNFSHPYASGSVSEFFRRWHVSLGSWFRDYVYIPLGGSRRGKARMVLALSAVWILTGLWHGGSVNFFLWALFLLALILLEKLVYPRIGKLGGILSRIHVLVLIPVSWVLFAIPEMPKLGRYLARMFPFFGVRGNVNPDDYIKRLPMYAPILILSALMCIPAVYRFLIKYRSKWFLKLALLVLFWVSMYFSAVSENNTFMYFGF